MESPTPALSDELTGHLTMTPDGAIVRCNSAFARIFGFDSVEQAQNANFTALLRSRKDAAELLELVRRNEVVDLQELEMRQLNGEPVYVLAHLAGRFDGQHKLAELQGYLFNDTKRKRLEQQLIQAQKMEGLGTLAGGIAHDFNNILAIILGYTMRLENWRTDPEQIPTAIRVIEEAVERGAALVQQLLTSARQTEARFAALDLNEALRELERMLQATFPKMIDFQLLLHPDLPVITADIGQIHQVLLNLCVNARDAMPDGGTITLETSVVPAAQLAEYFTGADAEKYACVRVTDTGSGMTPEVKSHIFEPFFTTKERGKGTGLGLSVVYGVVNNHRGFVRLESELARGTTFNIYLPIVHAIAAAQTPDPLPPRNHAQTILIVEDEEMLRELEIAILSGEGYRVLAAKDGLEALEIFSRHRDEIGLVVCDLGLPRLGGRDVFLKIKENTPGIRTIIASGYLEPSTRSELLKAGVIDTIQKPYDFRELVKKVELVIGTAQPVENGGVPA
ncbi:MAG: ATP-binding protein [Chthoniobacterales bacterium]